MMEYSARSFLWKGLHIESKDDCMKRLFQGGWVVDGNGRTRKDILVEGEKIIKVELGIRDEEAEVINVRGKLLFPGFIDPHTHFDLEVSQTITVDDFASGTRAAIVGGTTTILDFATQNRGETLKAALDNWNRKASGNCSCDYGYHMAISEWNESISEEIADMVEWGITSFKLYMIYDAMYLDDGAIYQALSRLKEVGGLAGVHCENRDLIAALVEEEKGKGNLYPQIHPRTRPVQAEAEAINRLLEIASLADAPVMVVHLSTARGYQVIQEARKRGQCVYVETCPQYLLLDDEKYNLQGFESAKYVISPPLRSRKDRDALWTALKKQEIQTVATDHCSFTMEQKRMGKKDFTKIPCGMPGVETRPSLLYTYGVKSGKITEAQMCRYLSEDVAKLYGMYPQKGAIQPGSDGDIVVWNPEGKQVLNWRNQYSSCDYNPYEGMEVWGRAEQVYLRGELVARDGEVICVGKGKYIHRSRSGGKEQSV
ncbi:dihydropyrimidinase [Aequitasia blattaphilus]